MSNIAKDMLSSLNDLIKEQQQVKNKHCRLTLVKFNKDVVTVLENKNLTKVKSLSVEDYNPNGCTALYDAIGYTMERFRFERDVSMIVITDGQENSSTKYTKKRIMKMIKEKQDYCGWNYVYLGCDLSIAAQGDSMGFKKSRYTSNCMVRKRNYCNFVKNKLSKAITKQRTQGLSIQAQLNTEY